MNSSDEGLCPQISPVCDEINNLFRTSQSIIITTHYGMDGDAVGSVVALAEVLSALGKRVLTVNSTPTPYNYKFIAPDGTFETSIPSGLDFDLVVSLDAANNARIEYHALCAKAVPLINIDHHFGNTNFGTINWVDGDSPCVGEMLLNFFERYDYAVSNRALDALFVSLMTDTGRFSFSNTNVRAFSAALRLVKRGVKPGKLASAVYFSKSVGKLKLLALAYSRLEFTCDNLIAYVCFTQAEMESFGLTEYETHEVVDIPRSCGSAELALYFLEKKDGSTKASSRSKSYFDCRALAEEFNGGGHVRAAGMRMSKPLAEAKDLILSRACQILGSICKLKD